MTNPIFKTQEERVYFLGTKVALQKGECTGMRRAATYFVNKNYNDHSI